MQENQEAIVIIIALGILLCGLVKFACVNMFGSENKSEPNLSVQEYQQLDHESDEFSPMP